MKLPEFLKPVGGALICAALFAGYYWYEHRSHSVEDEEPMQATVVVSKATNACFSDLVRVTGFVVPKREAVVGPDQEGSRVTDVFVHEGDVVTDNQELARLTPPQQQPGAPASPQAGRSVSLRAPAAGLVTEVRTVVGAPASPQAGPMFRIAVNGQIEIDSEVPSVNLLKLVPDRPVRITRDNLPDLSGRVRLVSPQIDRATQLGHVRIALNGNPGLKIGTFVGVNIDAKRSCGVAIPNTAIDHLTVQVVKGDTIQTRKVRVGLVSDTSTEILEGVDLDEIVVSDAGSSLHDGDQIKTTFADDLDRTRVR